MKASKSKTTKKTAKRTTKRVAKKELEESIMDKFMEVISNLGHDAGKLGKDIKKASKQLAKKLADKFHDVKETVEDKIESTKKSKVKIKKPLTTPRTPTSKSVAKAEKVVARVSKINAELKPKRAYTRRAVTPVTEQDTTTTRTKTPRATSGGLTGKSTNTKKPAATRRTPKVKVRAKAEPPAVVPKVTEVAGHTQDEKNNTIYDVNLRLIFN